MAAARAPRLAAVLLLAFGAVACTPNPYAGSYRGTFQTVGSGSADSGIWQADVNKAGYLKGTASSTAQQRNFAFDGEVDPNGTLEATIGVGDQSARFDGTIDAGGAVRGTWGGVIGKRSLEGRFSGGRVR